MGDPGFLAYATLILFIPLGLFFFTLTKPHKAVLWIYIGGALFLPCLVDLDMPGLPSIDKNSVVGLTAMMGIMLRSPRRGRLPRAFAGVGLLLPFMMLCSVGTVLTNGDDLWYGPKRFIQALVLKDSISLMALDFLLLAVPFMIGRTMFHTKEHLKDILSLIVAFALVYVLFILVELRMSPQFHRWIYGYGQSGFGQTIRWGGYRPMVFMIHGLALSLFMAQAVIAALGLAKARKRVAGFAARFLVPGLLVILGLCKSMGALVYGLLALVVVGAFRARGQARIASILAVVVLAYPALQASGAIPNEDIIEGIASFAPERAESLGFRLNTETELLEKMRDRPFFGWGGYGRSHIYETEMGHDISIVDGYWIIVLGIRGSIAAAAVFIVLLWPIFVAARRIRFVKDRKTQAMLGALSLILVFQTLDLIPNGMFVPLPMLLAGAMLGLLKGIVAEEREEELYDDDYDDEYDDYDDEYDDFDSWEDTGDYAEDTQTDLRYDDTYESSEGYDTYDSYGDDSYESYESDETATVLAPAVDEEDLDETSERRPPPANPFDPDWMPNTMSSTPKKKR